MSGLSFDLSPEQILLRDTVRKFSRTEIIPVAASFDRSGDFPKELIEKARSLGFVNLSLPDEYGGSGLSYVDCCLVVEELAYGCSGVTTSCVVNDLALIPIHLAGTHEQKEKFIGGITGGGKFASFCLSEPGAGSDVAGLSTRLTKVDGGYELTGAKQWISNGGVASQYTVFATLDPALGHKGICCVVVPADAAGVSHGHHEDKLGQRASNTTSVIFEKVQVPESARIGKEGEGFSIAMRTLDLSRPFTAMIAVGIAQRALDCALEYAGQRKQFGKPIGEFQMVGAMLADAATDIAAARWLTLHSAALADQKKRSSLESSMAKRFAADMAMRVTTDAVQIYGGYGYTKEYPVEKLMRDAKLMQIYEGTSQVQRVVIARELLGRK
ncbi:MAG: acyl-CoA dehydrogenase family protein [Bdellovibrionota bacterium]